MKRLALFLLFVCVAVVAVMAMERGSTPSVGEQPVIVELFTSQGCSSCPPADALLRRIANDPNLRGKVIPLAYHVDYWNHLGWRDPFSSPDWSQRQRDYVRSLKLGSAYTPQIVVNGARQMVGSSTFEIYKAIEEESKRAAAGSVTLTPVAGAVVVKARSTKPDVDLIVVTFENGATTKVIRGENRGKVLADDAIVRKLTRAATLDAGKTVETRVAVPEGLGVAAFLQERGQRRIVAAAVRLPAS